MIRKRLLFYFVVQIALVLLIAGFYLSYQIRSVIEKELASKLETTASAISVLVDASLISLLGPGDENTRIHKAFRQK